MSWGRLTAENYRGVHLPRALGIALALVAVLSTVAIAVGLGLEAAGWVALAGSLLVFGAGLIDDLYPTGPRGLRDHIRSLARGRMTTGVLKMAVVGACSVLVVALQPARPVWVQIVGVVLVAACTNVWNGLDVRPGRALKAFLVAGLCTIAVDRSLLPTLPGLVVLGAGPALYFDLRERAMLGDGGSNLLGFTVGLGLYLELPEWGVGAAAVLAVALNVLADTVTFSRLIDALPPLRWLDGLGRVRADG
jgi:UDP-N-acetylmuramyl pentapeptide phosphotransferase/UDP-N-acetylglucosamine-1-phosphate transferase